MSLIEWVILLSPLLLAIGVGIWSPRFVRGVADYLAVGRVWGRDVISLADVASVLAIETLMTQAKTYYMIEGIDQRRMPHDLGAREDNH